jgi:MTH538 TIR-like domain (DUF1863)
MSDWQRFLIPPPPAPIPVKRKIFISYCHLDQHEAEGFVSTWRNVFTARALGMAFSNKIINSVNPTYVMSRIRADYLGDSSVTIVLVGNCTHSRRYIDWELKASLQRGCPPPSDYSRGALGRHAEACSAHGQKVDDKAAGMWSYRRR